MNMEPCALKTGLLALKRSLPVCLQASELLKRSTASDLVGLAEELAAKGNLHALSLAPGHLQLAHREFATRSVSGAANGWR